MTGVAVVTGAGRGIGRGIALRLARAGWTIAAGDIDQTTAGSVAAEIGGDALAVSMDVRDGGAVDAAIDRIVAERGPIRVLVNNAGWDRLHLPFWESDPALWEQLIAINYVGVLHVTRAVVRRMVTTGGGRVVSIASDAGRVGSSGESVYSGCKAGVIGFSKALAREVARHGITVNVVCPGPIDTQLLASVMEGEYGQKVLAGMQRTIPLRRLGTPDDVAGAVAYFASDEAAYVTGQVLSVSGGLSMVG